MKIQWRAGSHFKVDPNIAKGVMDELANGEGLTPKNLVDVSRKKNAPLHDEFEWDNKVAGENWREFQARKMIGSIMIVSEEHMSEPVRAFFNIEYNQRTFEPTEVIMREADKKEQLLKIAKSELSSFRKKFSALNELSGIFNEIDKLLEE